MLVALVDMGDIAFQCFNQLRLGKAQNFIIVAAAVKRLSAILQVLHAARTALRHELAEIRPRVLRILIQHLFAVFVRLAPVAVLEEHESSLQKRIYVYIAADSNRLFDLRLGRAGRNNLLNAADKILHEAELRHILRLQVRKLLRQVVGIHVLICGNEHLFAVAVLDERKISRPLVFHPHGVEILGLCAEHYHDLGAVEGGEYVRLIGRAELVLKRDAREEHLEAFLRELMIKVICKDAVLCSSAAVIGLFVADEHIERLFFLRNRKNPLLNLVYRLSLILIKLFLIAVGIVQSGLVVIVIENRRKLSAVHGGNALVALRVFHIIDSVVAENERPIRLGVGVVLVEYLLIDSRRLVEIVVAAKMVRAVVKIRSSVVVQTGQGLLCAARVAHADGIPGVKFYCAAAHFTFEK